MMVERANNNDKKIINKIASYYKVVQIEILMKIFVKINKIFFLILRFI